MISSFEDVVLMLMKHGATRKQAEQIMVDVYLHTPKGPLTDERKRERAYQAAKWSIEKAKEYGRQNAETTMGHRE